MDTQNSQDILASINEKSIEEVQITDLIWNLEKELQEISSAEILNSDINEIDSDFTDNKEEILDLGFVNEVEKINSKRKYSTVKCLFKKIKLWQKIKFLSYYVFVSTFVFFILLWATNYSAYSKMIYSYVNPSYLKDSSKDILDTMDNWKIKVFADEVNKDDWVSVSKKTEIEDKISTQTNFSPKKLVKTDKDVNLDLEITPYENRIIIPKIGKNIPLVDVDPRRWLSFENLQDVFMNELQKWVVRYPWTSAPWEVGNVFVFWHSSNYPWIKWDYNDVFALLDDLSFWDEIIVYYNQKKFTYIIREKQIIKPGDVKVLSREQWKKELSLMTCWPVWTAINRMIVFAELKE